MKFAPGNAQDIGSRSEQQDAFGFSDPSDPSIVAHAGIAAVVADGMGGMENGSAASLTAVRAFLAAYQSKTGVEPIPDALVRSIEAANAEVARLAIETGAKDNLGTTLAGAVLHEDSLYWISAGDSRIYYYASAERRVYQLTRDHIYAFELEQRVRNGHMSAQEAATHPERAALTSYLGMERLPLIDRSVEGFPVNPGDSVLICSDGLYRALSEEEMAGSIEAEPRKSCAKLVEQALRKQIAAQDNITVVALHCLDAKTGKGWPARVGGIAACLALLTGGAVYSRMARPQVLQFTADRTAIDPGQSATLAWSVDRGAVTITPAPGSVAQPRGSLTVSPTRRTTYVLTASNFFGSAKRTIDVDVSPSALAVAAASPLIAEFRAEPSSIQPGQSVTLHWKTTGEARLNGEAAPPTGSKVVSGLRGNSSFTLSASKAGAKPETRTLTVSVGHGAPLIKAFSATPNSIAAGKQATLNWTVASAKSVTLAREGGPPTTVKPTGSMRVTPQQTTIYTLTAAAAGGAPVTQTAVVTVAAARIKPVVIASFASDRRVVDPGGSVTIAWVVSGDAHSVAIEPDIGTVVPKGSKQVVVNAKTVFTLKATDAGGSTLTQTLTVDVAAGPKIERFEVVRDGANLLLHWRVSSPDRATQINIDPEIGPVEAASPPEGLTLVNPADHYTITVKGPGDHIETRSVSLPPQR